MDAPAPINSASLHPEKDFFVAGGEDFKLYKFDYSTMEEMGEKQEDCLLLTSVFIIPVHEVITVSVKSCRAFIHQFQH